MTKPHFIALVGTNADFSYNRILLQFMSRTYTDQAEIEVREIADIPLFNENQMKNPPVSVTALSAAIDAADGVIIASPEYDHAIPAALKSVLEWLSSATHPFQNKPVMVVGTSYGVQGTVRAQTNLRQVLDAPGVQACVLPGNEFMLPTVKDKFDQQGQLVDDRSVSFLGQCLANFVQFAALNPVSVSA
ncbi:NADPH-dependent FMN reductase [Levilactobacillus zymae]|uniref:Fumarate reductase flavoprotein subunit n=1 Tax=Levilactobacillus zymae TaxID=267363 RepID=A0A1Y6JZX9_9LACO|nr:NADPH-dependent FMN reductase [Levilactobacillus zymae]KRL12651.1 flavin oxidoreductase [Levilactobacillus zymae DSM 19395]QFR61959.1 flavin reductase [Levilactobacillus zymae]GEO72367.1 hypothetical protein LZY01_15350 [Levilactobacillus zymae]SMS15468.1 Fumarate reductase flavoprotein subunit [Levilactobacillus zymae]